MNKKERSRTWIVTVQLTEQYTHNIIVDVLSGLGTKYFAYYTSQEKINILLYWPTVRMNPQRHFAKMEATVEKNNSIVDCIKSFLCYSDLVEYGNRPKIRDEVSTEENTLDITQLFSYMNIDMVEEENNERLEEAVPKKVIVSKPTLTAAVRKKAVRK